MLVCKTGRLPFEVPGEGLEAHSFFPPDDSSSHFLQMSTCFQTLQSHCYTVFPSSCLKAKIIAGALAFCCEYKEKDQENHKDAGPNVV